MDLLDIWPLSIPKGVLQTKNPVGCNYYNVNARYSETAENSMAA